MKVEYVGTCGYFDGVHVSKIYEVIKEENEQYIIKNEIGVISHVAKNKFNIVEE